ncbi:MAG: HAMP domain-containing histidine kinase [Saprospiraceae bacterium]|nr:HAMP domain-containing histidine kinase [Saprospiraceae bacterium]
MSNSNKLNWKISATFHLVMVVLGVVYVLVSAYTYRNYTLETSQKLHAHLADHLVEETKPLVNGKPDTAATHDIMHSMMVINPSVEVYLLDTTGRIIDYVVPFSTVKREQVSLDPVRKFIEAQGELFILGDCPKAPGAQNIFSASPIFEGEKLTGYAYIILAGMAQQEVGSTLLSSYFLKTGSFIFLATLIASLLVGLFAIWLITRNLQDIIEVVRRFKEGDSKARVPNAKGSDLALLSTTFNDMADTIGANIEELKSVENLRRELIANVSHDLRTPLAIMQGYVETMLIKNDTLTPGERRQYLETTLGSSEKLAKLISQLFEYSKLEAKQIQPRKEPFFIAELAQDVHQKYQIIAKQKGITLQLDQPKDLPMVFADLGLVERVIQNLMDNALKFTPQGGKVSIALRAMDSSVEVRIADTGPGIPESEQSAIFERYRKAASGHVQQSAGAGLGLAIAKKILVLHDATIRVQSKLNEGTAFMFQLPVAA